jgi:hypothetical protein
MPEPKHSERAPSHRQRRVYGTEALPRHLRAAIAAARPTANAPQSDEEASGGRAGALTGLKNPHSTP